MFIFALCLALCLGCAQATPEADRVMILPGLSSQPSFRHYSGYLRAGGDRYLHYWFFEASEVDPNAAPVVLWLNGGPGCSSMFGLLSENGPFRVNDQARLDVNPYSWNREANMLYLDAPAGVGYSYTDNGNTTTDDDQVADDNYYALQSFLNKFPEYAGRDLFIAGESYAGVYIPTLAVRVLQNFPRLSRTFQDSQFSMKLKGIAIGNGFVSYTHSDNSLFYYMYYHGIVGNNEWSLVFNACCDKSSESVCKIAKQYNFARCEKAITKSPTMQDITNSNKGINRINLYNRFAPCHGGISESSFNPVNDNSNDNYPCVNSTALTNYMNDPLVKYAIHVNTSLPPFKNCQRLNYKKFYPTNTQNLFNVYTQHLLSSGIRILHYNGEGDLLCDYIGAQWFLDSFGLKTRIPRRAWYYQDPSEGRQIGGYAEQWHNVTFTTVTGAGHMVPADKPVQAFTLFYNFLHNIDF